MHDLRQPGCAAERPSLSRFDRPAFTMDDLLRPDGRDFIHVATWTLKGRRADAAELAAFAPLLSQQGKAAVLRSIAEQVPPGTLLPMIEGLSALLRREKLRSRPVVGPVLVIVAGLNDRFALLRWPARCLRAVPRAGRWLARHGRRAVVQVAGWINLPTLVHVRQRLGLAHARPEAPLSPRAREIYLQLCKVVDRAGRAR